MVMRARKRNMMVFRPGEPEAYEHAQNTRFNTAVDGMIADPAGRGPTPATGPLGMRPSATAEQLTETTDAALANHRQARTGDPNDPEAGDTLARPEIAPMATSPLARTPQAGYPNDPEKGDTEAIPGLEFPGEAPPQTAPVQKTPASFSNGQAPAPIDAAANAPQKPDYGRVKAEQIAPQSAGTAPPGGDKWLAAMRGVGSVLQSAGGRADQGMKSGLDAYSDFQDQERELRDFQGKQAALDADTAREQRGENRHAEGTNYGRARDEDATHRQNTNDRFAQDDRLAQRGFMERGEARDVAGTEYERGQGRQDALSDYEKKKQIDRKYERPRGGGAGGAGQMQRDAAYRGMMDSARELYPNGVPQNVQNEIALRAMHKDPAGQASGFIDGMRAETAARGDKQATQAIAAAKSQGAMEAAQKESEASISDLLELRKAVERRIGAHSNTIPGTFPGESMGRAALGAVKQAASGVGLPAFDPRPEPKPGESPEQFEARLGEYKRTEYGPTGYSQDDSTINSFSKLMGRSNYNTSTDNSANLASEQQVADEWARSNSTPQAMLDRIDAQIAKEQNAVKTGQHRAFRGANAAQPQGQVFTNPEEM